MKTPDELNDRHQEIQKEEWRRSTDGRQNVRALARLVEEAVEKEREACAKVCDDLYESNDVAWEDGGTVVDRHLMMAAASIRARSAPPLQSQAPTKKENEA